MKLTTFLVFFGIVLSVYTLVNYYIFSRGMLALPAHSQIRAMFPWIYWGLASSYVVARVLERVWLGPVSDIFMWVGSIWLSVFVYLLLSVLLVDLLRAVNYFVPFWNSIVGPETEKYKLFLFWGVISVTGLVVIGGFINAATPRVNHYKLELDKELPMEGIRIVAASDIHLGTLIGPSHVKNLVRLVNNQNPDIILLAGDVVDEDIAPVIRYDLGSYLKKLSAPMGVYAITGNHEYIGGAESAVTYLSKYGLKILRDTTVLVNNQLVIVGREDKDKSRFSGKPRKGIEELMKGVDQTKPVILLDHQPFNLDDAKKIPADIQISGHTHHGQLWPFGYITSAIFELSSGYLKKGGTHYFVSNGFGTWGPPVRTGNRPEILVIDIFGKNR